MSQINLTYFRGDIELPNTAKPAMKEALQWAVDVHEKQILLDLLGYELYTEYIAGITEVAPAQKWLNLRDGATFDLEFNGVTIPTKWNGLLNAEKKSLISYYVYFMFIQENTTSTSGIGEVMSNVENSERISPAHKMSNAWTQMLKLYGKVPRLSVSNDNESYVVHNNEPSAYNFLLTNIADYDSWIFKRQGLVNEFGF